MQDAILGNVTGAILVHHAVGGAEVVVSAIDLNQTNLLDHIIHIVIITDNTVLLFNRNIRLFRLFNNHFAICTEGIGACGDSRCTFINTVSSDVTGTIFVHDTIAGTEVVIVVVHLDQANLCNEAVLQVIAVGFSVQNTGGSQSLLQFAILSKQIHLVASIGVILVGSDGTVASATVAMVIEIIGFTIDNLPAVLIGTGTVEILNACFLLNPNTRNQLTLNKGILQLVGQTKVCLRVGSVVTSISGGIEVIPAILYHLPTLLQLTGDCIIGIAVVLNQTGNFCSCTTIRASQNTGMIIILVTVAISSGDCTPVNNRSAAIAVGSAGVAVLGASYRLVNQCNDLMDMPGVNRVIDHGFHGIVAVEGNHFTINGLCITKENIVVNGHDRAVAGSELFFRGNGLAGNAVNAVPGPDTDRQADQSLFTGQLAVAGLGDGNNSNVIGRVDVRCSRHSGIAVVSAENLIYCREARCQNHVIQFPLVGAVQFDADFCIIDRSNVGGLDIDVVNRVHLRQLSGVIVTGHIHQALLLGVSHGEGCGGLGIVAQIVGNLKGDNMGAVFQLNTFCGHIAAGNLGVCLVAVDVNLSGFYVQTHSIILIVVCNSSGESDGVCCNGSTFCLQRLICSSIHDIANNRSFPVIHSGAVIQGDIVNVEGVHCGCHGLNVSTYERRRTGIAYIGCHRHANIIILGNVDGSIDPTGLGNIRLSARVQILSHTADGSEHKVVLLAAQGTVGVLDIQLRLESQTGSAFGDIHPHTQRGGVLAVGDITQDYSLIGHIEQNVVGPSGKIRVSIVQRPCQSMVAVLNLSVFGGCQAGIAVNIAGVLACHRIGANQGICHTVVNAPLLGFVKAHPVGDIAVFEIEQDFRALAEVDYEAQLSHLCVLIHSLDNNTLHALVAGAIEDHVLQIQSTGIGLGSAPFKAVCLEIHGILAHSIGPDIQGQRSALAIGQNGAAHRELSNSGVGDDNGLLGNSAVYAVADGDFTQSTIGSKGSVCVNSTEAVVAQRPCAALGHSHFSAGGVDGDYAEGIGGSRHIVVIGCFHIGMVEDAGFDTLLLGQEHRVQGGTLGTIRGDGTHSQVGFAFTTGNEGG